MSADSRTIIVATRLSAVELHVTYCNALTARRPYIMTVQLHSEPFNAIGLRPEDVPAIGETRYVVID